ncbi:response regulator [Paenibacillus sp. H1-7]|uniref:response regulator transcription factor n=1 Tax=Paenibacillus sp. H1-7 TaxID=2282849 RepID=UPI001EF89EFD|nr:response regulator [Paenibacillus sp. H1-7]ULL17109.1 response regulator [Paenibacillus sp. H1-7]
MRIVIVEDEEKIRYSIVRFIHKVSDAYQVVGECENGDVGLGTIRRLKPDLIITDIRMPVMNGIEMLEKLKEGGGSPPRTIILSGYSDFEYARKALQFGTVIEYLLKPVTADDLKQALLRAEAECSSSYIDGRSPDREDWIKQLLAEAEWDWDHVPPSIKPWLADDAAVDGYTASVYLGKEYEQSVTVVKERLRSALKQEPSVQEVVMENFPEHSEIMIYLQRTPFSASYRPNVLWEHLHAQLRSLSLDDLVVTWAHVPQFRQLKEAFLEARAIRKWSLVQNCRCYNREFIEKLPDKPFAYPAQKEWSIKEAVSNRDQEKLMQQADCFVSQCMSEAVDPQDVIDAGIRLVSAMLHVAGAVLGEALGPGEIYHRLSLVQTPNELRCVLRETVDRIGAAFDRTPSSYSLVINKCLKIIKDRYHSGITLEALAHSLHITPEYLSSLFQKELGISFTAFLKDTRITRAKQLLIGSGLKTFEVAERVGYSDAKYFSRVFKEMTGTTPGEFQRLHR